jgi:hypothetical protein
MVSRVTDNEKPTLIEGEGLLGEAFCDVTLIGIVWKDEGVNLDLELPDAKLVGSAAARLVSRWLHSLVITLDLTKNPGPPLTWNGKVTRSPTRGFRLSLDFASSGGITLECEELELQRRV